MQNLCRGGNMSGYSGIRTIGKNILLAFVVLSVLGLSACLKSISSRPTIVATKVKVSGQELNCYWRIDRVVGAEARLLAYVCRHANSYRLHIVDGSTPKAKALSSKWRPTTSSSYTR